MPHINCSSGAYYRHTQVISFIMDMVMADLVSQNVDPVQDIDLSTSSVTPGVDTTRQSSTDPATLNQSSLANEMRNDSELATLIRENRALARVDASAFEAQQSLGRVSQNQQADQTARAQSVPAREMTAAEQRSILQSIERQASSIAERDHNRHPNQQPDSRSMEERIRETLEAAVKKGLPLSEEFVQSVVARMQERYEERRSELFSEMPWYKRGYYSVTSFCSSCWDGLKNISSTIYKASEKALKALADPKTREAIVDGVKKAWDATVEYVTNPDKLLADVKAGFNYTVDAIGTGLAAAGNYITSGQVLTDLQAAGSYVLNQTLELGSNILQGAKWVLNNPGAALQALGSATLAFVSDPIGSVQKSIGAAWEALGQTTVGSFITGMSDSLGVTSLVRGTWNLTVGAIGAAYAQTIKTVKSLGSDLGRVLSGDISVSEMFSNLGNNLLSIPGAYVSKLGEGLEAIKGGAILFLEVSGLMDLGMMAYHGYKFVEAYANDDKAGMIEHGLMFGMHTACAAMSIGAIAATVSTAGAAGGAIVGAALMRTGIKTAAKEVLKSAAKNFVKTAAKEMGQEVVERLGKELSTEVIEATAREIAEQGGRELAEKIVQEGSSEVLTTQTRAVMADVSEQLTERMLRDANLVKHVDDVTTELLEGIHNSSVRELTQQLEAAGVTNARGTAKELKKLIKNGKADAEIKEILEDNITTAVREHLETHMEQAFKTQFRGMLDGTARASLEQSQKELLERSGVESAEQLSKAARKEFDDLGKQIKHCETLERAAKEEAERLGKTLDNYIDDVVEDGWKGVKEGIEKATRKLVREGIEKAFARFREGGRFRPRSDMEKKDVDLVNADEGQTEIATGVELKKDKTILSAVITQDENKTLTRVEHAVDAEGRPVARYFTFDAELNEWLLTGVEVGAAREVSVNAADEVLADIDRNIVNPSSINIVVEQKTITQSSSLAIASYASEGDMFTQTAETTTVESYSSNTVRQVLANVSSGLDLKHYENRVLDIARTAIENRDAPQILSMEEALNQERYERLVARIGENLKNSDIAA